MDADHYPLLAVAIVVVGTVAIGGFGVRFARTTSDFLVASRTVNPRWNAAAISGEYLSAASFLGVAGLVLKEGADALWYPVGFTAGYLALLLFVAAPLRRSGAYTLPDFAEARLRSVALRRVATVLVVLIGWLYLVPQLQGAGLTLSVFSTWPVWVGAVVVAVVVVLNVIIGGLRSITFVQAFQYWLTLTAIAVPVFVLLITQASVFDAARDTAGADRPPAFVEDTAITVRTNVLLRVDEDVRFDATGTVDGSIVDDTVHWGIGEHEVLAGTTLRFSAGMPVPVVSGSPADNESWLRPAYGGRGNYSLFMTYSLILATFLGAMGLPHVLVRFYTNPDGKAARSTTLVVLGLLGLFYLFPTVFGLLGRLYVPQLLVTGETDATVLLLPDAVLDSWPAMLLAALVASGAFAAFLAAASGLILSVAGVLSTDVLPGRIRDYRVAAVLAGAVPLAFALSAQSIDLAKVVGMVFAVAASSFCPLLILGIWWRGLTDAGALAGLILGGGAAVAAVLATLLRAAPDGRLGELMAQPAAITVPIAFLTMILVSKMSARRVPGDVARILARLHAPERLGLARDREIRTAPPPGPSSRAGRHRR